MIFVQSEPLTWVIKMPVLDVGCEDDCKDTPAVAVQGKLIKAICRELGISRKAVRKVLRSEETDFRYKRKHQP